MLENTTIIKAIGGVAVAGGSVGGGYYVYKSGLFASSHETNYLVQQTSANASSGNTLYKNAAETNSEKEFKCQSVADTKQIDEDCEIYSLTVDTNKKYLGLSEMYDLTKQPLIKETSKLTQNSYFRLKINNKKIFSEFAYDGKALIKIIKKTDSSEYVQLKILAKINENSVATSNTLILAKSNKVGKDETISETDTKCNIGTKTDEINCKVYSLDNSFTMSNITFATTTALTNLKNTTDQKYFLIDFSTATEEHKKLLNPDDLKTIKTFKNKTDNPQSEFLFEALMVGNVSDSNKQLFLLKK